MLLLQSMSKQEGYGIAGARPTRNNNPLDLMYGDEAIRFGATGADGRYAKFDTSTWGWYAAGRWLHIPAHFTAVDPGDGRPLGPSGYLIGGYLGATLKQVIFRFCPKGDGANDPQAYLDTVIKNTTTPRTLTEDTILTADLLTVPSA